MPRGSKETGTVSAWARATNSPAPPARRTATLEVVDLVEDLRNNPMDGDDKACHYTFGEGRSPSPKSLLTSIPGGSAERREWVTGFEPATSSLGNVTTADAPGL